MTTCIGLTRVRRLVGVPGAAAVTDGDTTTARFAAALDIAASLDGTKVYVIDSEAIRVIDVAALSVTTAYTATPGRSISTCHVGQTTGRIYFSEQYGLSYLDPATYVKTTVLADNTGATGPAGFSASSGLRGVTLNAAETKAYVGLNGYTGFSDNGRLVRYSTSTWTQDWNVSSGGFFDPIVDVALDEANGYLYCSTSGFDRGIRKFSEAAGVLDGAYFRSTAPFYVIFQSPDLLIWDDITDTVVVKTTLTAPWTAGNVSCDMPKTVAEPSGWAPSGITVVNDTYWVADRTAIYEITAGGWSVGQVGWA